MGYVGEEEKTKEAIDSEGRLHSGDVGRVEVSSMEAILACHTALSIE